MKGLQSQHNINSEPALVEGHEYVIAACLPYINLEAMPRVKPKPGLNYTVVAGMLWYLTVHSHY